MGFLDKLKNVGKEALKASGVTITKLPDALVDNENATFIEEEDFVKNGSIRGGDLPEAKGVSLYYTIDAETDELIIVHRIEKMMSCKYKVLKKIPISAIVAFKAKEKKDIPLNTSVMHSYESVITTTDGESYELHQRWTQRSGSDFTSLSIRDEINAMVGLNNVLLSFFSLVTDDFTKQWYNAISIERGLEAVFDEDGNSDLTVFMDMIANWFKIKTEEWENRMKQVQI